MMGFYGPGMWLYGFVMTVLFLAALVVVVAWATHVFAGTERRQDGGSAREVLDRRFAAGEISAEEYERARRTLDRDR